MDVYCGVMNKYIRREECGVRVIRVTGNKRWSREKLSVVCIALILYLSIRHSSDQGLPLVAGHNFYRPIRRRVCENTSIFMSVKFVCTVRFPSLVQRGRSLVVFKLQGKDNEEAVE